MSSDFNEAICTSQSFGQAPILVFCDHASNAIPASLNCLGLPDDLLATHIAWDIGARDTAREIASRLGARFFACGFSRLIVDPNRDLTAADLIPVVADQIPVPGNQTLTDDERQHRIDEFHRPYHHALGEEISSLAADYRAPLAISIHSFTSRLMGAGDERPWPIGLLWREDEPSARFMIERLGETTGWPIGDNEPYDARVFNYSVDRHLGPRGLQHLTIEVRQDRISDPDGVDEIAGLLSDAIGQRLNQG